MIRLILVAVGVALLLTNSALAQSGANCDQIRQAVAQYGYAAARAHAMANYGAQAVRNGDRCLAGMRRAGTHRVGKHRVVRHRTVRHRTRT
jgi:hypothetical protein